MIKRYLPRAVGTSLVSLALMCVPLSAFAQSSPITIGGGGYASPAPVDCEAGLSGSESIQSTTTDGRPTAADEMSALVIEVAEFMLWLV
ncbi:MAG: hypothetical protein H7Z16_07440 [Pyrinomonadaceae bacterium]|nr:hypothetical protein [Pyrinomonadaceae bacterium]